MKRTQASRLILVKPNMFNKDSNEKLKEKIFSYLAMFKYDECVTEKIPVYTVADSNKETYKVHEETDFVIRDSVEPETHDVFRQLVFKDNPTEIQSEVKLKLSSKKKAKDDNFTTLPTVDKYSSKGIVTCLDDSFICSFYIKVVLTGISFLSTSKDFPKRKLRFLILGAGIGSINFYFHRIFKDNVEIDCVEIDKRFKDVGEKYFGFADNKNDRWFYEDARTFIQNCSSECTNDPSKKYDMVIIDINNLNTIEGISPPPDFFNGNNVNYIYVIEF